ncbi:MAG: multiheme c-type cytochrome [Thermodesulfobacteriota bacterium]
MRIFLIFWLLCAGSPAFAQNGRAPVSEATEACLGCHSSLHPGIVEEWQKSRHARVSPAEGMAIKGRASRISAETIPERLKKTSVGCAECHTLRPDAHADTFEHNGAAVHVVVSPGDCAVCHPVEADQYEENIMSHARKNLTDNPVFQDLQQAIIGMPDFHEGKLDFRESASETRAEACYYCHGTRLRFQGLNRRETVMGEMTFPRIAGWPNQGVGRVNLDGSRGSCAACHTRHAFAIEVARRPHTCKECHVGPDVPAYKVYSASKHGAIYSSQGQDWEFSTVPWAVGKDFNAPTCAACHISLLINTDGVTVAERTHAMKERLPWRIFGLIYAHPHPQSPDTTRIRNREGNPLPTDFDGGYASEYLIDGAEQERRTQTMQAVCLSCHSTPWVEGHWRRFEHTIRETNARVRTGTRIMSEIWNRGFAEGLDRGESPFDESVERLWSDTWLFYANTIRFASAMAGGGDYGVFADGRHALSRRIQELHDWLALRKRLFPPKTPIAGPSPEPDERFGKADAGPPYVDSDEPLARFFR